jgi:hypothetical protein
MQVARKLVELCKAGKNLDAVNMLYAPNVVSIEPQGDETMPARMEGLDAVRKKNQWWLDNHTIHSHEVLGPWPHGDRFIVLFRYDVTGTGGKMKGMRMKLEETGLYTVTNGKITKEEFFYAMPG